jgi:histidinol-phosphate aminotransferase
MTSPKKTVEKMEGYETPAFLENYRLKLDLNENVMGPSPKVLKSLQSLTEQDIKYYPAYGEVINKIAEYNNVSAEMILPTSGADEAINYVFDTFITPEDTILTITPSFAMPKIYAEIIGCNYQEINYTEKFVFPISDILDNIKEETKLIVVTTPNNPTGEAISRENLLKIIDKAAGKLILIDETYFNYAKESFIDLLEKYSNILIMRSMSKDFGLAGLRFGYIIANKNYISQIKKVIRPFSVNNIAVKAAIAALDDVEYLNYVVSQVKESKTILTEALKPFAKKIYESDANFLLVDFGEKAEFIYKKLLKSGIKVKNFGNAKGLENCLRIAMPSVENTKLIIEALKQRDLVVFDIDGVLIDTRNSYRTAIKETYKHFAEKEISPEEIQNAKNLGGLNNDWDLTEYLLQKSGVNIEKAQIISKFQELYWGNNGDGVILNEELLVSPESIKKMANQYDLAIFTGRPKAEADFVLKRWHLENYFSPVITMDDLPQDKQKPEPDGLLKIIDIVCPNEVFYLGDTHDDMISAKKAGVRAIGVLPPQDKSAELIQKLDNNGAEKVVNKAEDFIAVLNNGKVLL